MDNDLISRSALEDKLRPYSLETGSTLGRHSGMIDLAIDIVRASPAVDAVEVVRCRECVHDGLPTCFTCYIEQHEMIFLNHDPEFFCGSGERKAYGERRTE